jgi:hypothetical protein
MSSKPRDADWKPDDSHLGRGGEAGAEDVDRFLKEAGLSLEGILTSRDKGIDMVRYQLRKPQPPGWQSWQIPAYLRTKVTHFFLQVAQPGSILPEHEHEVAQFRLILSGHVIYNGVVLGCGDWIYTAKGEKYTLSVATNGAEPAIICYCY